MQMLIDGQWVGGSKEIPVYDPYTGDLVDVVPKGTSEDVDRAISAAVEGYKINRSLSSGERAVILRRAADLLEKRQEEFAVLIAREGSKTIREARKEAYRCTQTLRVSGEEATRILGETISFDQQKGSENRRGYYYRFPIGVVGAITPFNDPLNLVAHKVGPAIAGGNGVVLKPATVTPLSALKLADLLLEAGLPPEILNVVTGPGGEVGAALVSDPRVRMISFTGGVEAGLEVTRSAGLKKIGMELGSNSPVVVLGDCDFEQAVDSCVSGAFWAAGQNCIGVQRIYVEEEVFPAFRNAFVEKTQRYKVGPKLEEDCDMGPLITEGEAERVEAWVEEALAAGATLECGHRREGATYRPTVLTGVADGMKVDCEEIFGPVVNLYPVKDLKEGIERSNAVDFGLQAAVFTSSLASAFEAVEGLEAGAVIVNDSTDYRMDAMPFGGIKSSGLGREGIRFALQEMTEPKAVCLNL
ncbi:MAG: aldehyde dehydrogenase family protein [Gemmatimonadetes bacterium]|nr:aldehyde dehydrogenase family protein [Gemmatimonadota bacterium]NNM04891.1 aldehyde dehydrogenase family protein [Gemmatimonadota bacterium]